MGERWSWGKCREGRAQRVSPDEQIITASAIRPIVAAVGAGRRFEGYVEIAAIVRQASMFAICCTFTVQRSRKTEGPGPNAKEDGCTHGARDT